MAIVNVNDQNFDATIQNGLVLVDFWAPWCGPCKMIAPILEELNKEEGNRVTIAKLNVDENPATAANYHIMGIPTLKLFKDGKEVKTVMGAQPLGVLQEMVAQYAEAK